MDVNGVKVGLVGTYELADGMGCEDEMIANIKAVEEAGGSDRHRELPLGS